MKKLRWKIMISTLILLPLLQQNQQKIHAMTNGDVLELYGEYRLKEYDISKLEKENKQLEEDIKELSDNIRKKGLYNKALMKGTNYYQDVADDLEEQVDKIQRRLDYARQQIELKKDAPFEELIEWEIWYAEQKDSLNTIVADIYQFKDVVPFKVESIQAEMKKIQKKQQRIIDNNLKITYSFKYPQLCEGTVPKFPLVNIKKKIFSSFGQRQAPFEGASTNHEGVDYKAQEGAEVQNVFEGSVIDAGYDDTLGYFIKIDNFFGVVTLYAHMSQVFVEKGDWVKEEEILGLSGSTGISTGAHLHFAIYVNDKARDPEKLFHNERKVG